MRWQVVLVLVQICYLCVLCDDERTDRNITVNGPGSDNGPIISGNPDESNGKKGRFFNSTDSSQSKPLDDLSLDDVPMLMHTHDTSTHRPTTQIVTNNTKSIITCTEDNKVYKVGEQFNRGCNESCVCESNGQIVCGERCKLPFREKGYKGRDEFCQEVPTQDECCVILQCTQDTETEPLEGCVHKNQSFHRGEMFNDGCEAVCSCGDAGTVRCKPRCPQIANNSSEQCVQVPDPADPCCTVVFCDVTLGDQDVNKLGGTEETPSDSQVRLKSADALNTTSAIIHFLGEPELDSNLTAEVSEDQVKWNKTELDGVIVHNLKPGKTYYIRVISGGMVSNAVSISLPKNTPDVIYTPSAETTSPSTTSTTTTTTTSTTPKTQTQSVLTANTTSKENSTEENDAVEFCEYKNHNYTVGEEFNDGCISYCICTETGVDCSAIECPSEFGLDVLDPTCIKWETRPKDFNPEPPNCCPDKVKCLDNGSCNFMGEVFPNWADIPTKISGCEKRCYCEFGNVTCQDVCPPVPATPPPELPCPAQQAMLHHLPGDDCCLIWVCPQIHHPGNGQLPHGFPGLPAHGHVVQNGVVVQVLEPLDEHTVRLAFSVPPLLVGLHGRVEVRYTATKHDQDPSTWELQVLAPPGDLIATPQLHFDLGNLLPDTTYSIIIKIILRDLSNMPQSPVLTVRTLPPSSPITTLPPQIPIDSGLSIGELNATWVLVNWRKFTQFEMQFIDGVQLRYKDEEANLYLDTPLIHRLVTSYKIEGLKPNCTYEVKLFLIPFPGQTTELDSERSLAVKTPPINDPFDFTITLEVLTAKSSSVEVTWTGVPYPEDRFVNIYKIVYKSETGKEDYNSFKVAKRDAVPKASISDLKPITRYLVWLEAYLTNGKLKKSNEQEFLTKPGSSLPASPTFQGKLSGTPPTMEPGDYYGPLVAVAILAALAIMAALILLLVLMKKHGQNKAAISSRTSQSAYDNPSYKTCEGDQQTGTSNGRVNGGNSISRPNP